MTTCTGTNYCCRRITHPVPQIFLACPIDNANSAWLWSFKGCCKYLGSSKWATYRQIIRDNLPTAVAHLIYACNCLLISVECLLLDIWIKYGPLYQFKYFPQFFDLPHSCQTGLKGIINLNCHCSSNEWNLRLVVSLHTSSLVTGKDKFDRHCCLV